MENLEIYNKYKSVPKEALKPFDNGKFKGTDINTMWRLKCLTEQFGVCGFGWVTRVIRTWTEKGASFDGETEVLAFAEIGMKVKINGEWSEEFTATGGNTLLRHTNKGYWSASDEAFKMAITDAFGVACKYLGIGADVYWENDRTKYTETETEKPKSQYIVDEVTISDRQAVLTMLCNDKGITLDSCNEWLKRKTHNASITWQNAPEEVYNAMVDALEKK